MVKTNNKWRGVSVNGLAVHLKTPQQATEDCFGLVSPR